MSQMTDFLYEIGEPLAAGFFEEPEATPLYRFSLAMRRFWERMPMPNYYGGELYPSGPKHTAPFAVWPDYSYTVAMNGDLLTQKGAGEYREQIEREMNVLPYAPPSPHFVGGYVYTHSIPHFERVEQEGLNRYRERILAGGDTDFSRSLLCVLEGIECYRRRAVEKLWAENAPQKLIDALEKVPFEPAETLYEAVVCRNFIYYIDGCDNPGRLDAAWMAYYQGEDITSLLREFFRNVDENGGWSASIGPDYNPLTLQVLKAIQGFRRPSLELRVTPDMPAEIWQAAAEALATGGGQPSLYNEALYQKVLAEAFPQLSETDRKRFNGGGCTETMLAGISRVGSLDAGINVALVFSQVLQQELAHCADYGTFYQKLMAELSRQTDETLEHVRQLYQRRAERLPQPVRTLLIDDCIDRQTEYNNGGARADWSVINFAGLINVIDSLQAVKELVFETKEYDAETFLTLLRKEDPAFFARLKRCSHYGVDDTAVDTLGAVFVADTFALLEGRKTYFGTPYLPSSIQFVTYADAGRPVPATPDGRKAGAPLCDSVGALEGKDTAGPTALLNSVSRLPLSQAIGTPVLNLRMQKQQVAVSLRPLIAAFFEKGGMQVQISCVSREDMEDALVHPEKHENLIVRIGGYSEYFNWLSHELKETVIRRTEY